ncbi:hypothetical protein OG883_29435 [Streptomyces sp. NBC_01142]|uniref:hypothetical protein n=1 Tax=Streptomyces sp. NBC_01142 TaxID=2975865 RepID=UPI00225126B3|nr:hypothetical protein [Streptomyces sp. NBC_01142]MCX4823926.1 hypothetical protein [Streptomyces sp. NBC_01142]
MAEPQSNARLRADAGAPTSGVIHVRTRLTVDFTVIANALAQRRGSAVTVGVAAYIASLPDGASVSIATLCDHFTEGEILISRALRELEAAGYLERRRERGPGGLIRTRTYFYDVPGRGLPSPPPPTPPHRRRPAAEPVPAQTPRPEAAPGTRPAAPTQAGPVPRPEPAQGLTPPTAPEAGDAPDTAPPPQLAEDDPQAVAILASLRIRDRRLILSRREVAELAPAVSQWLAQGTGPEEITEFLTTGLPDRFRCRPARILGFRLRDLPVAAPTQAATPPVLPWQTCDGGCERAFRAAEPGRCRDCPPDDVTPADPAITHDDHLRAAC